MVIPLRYFFIAGLLASLAVIGRTEDRCADTLDPVAESRALVEEALKLVGPGRLELIAKKILSELPAATQSTIQSQCARRPASCMLKALYGDETVANLASALALRTGYYASMKPGESGATEPWTAEHLRAQYFNITKVPAHLLPKDFFPIRLIPEGNLECNKQLNALGCYAYSEILIRTRKATDDRSIIHEIGHQVNFGMGGNDYERGRPGYDALTSRYPCQLSFYAGVGGPIENYAENFQTYLNDPVEQRISCPKVFDYFRKNVFTSRDARAVDYVYQWDLPVQQVLASEQIRAAASSCMSLIAELNPTPNGLKFKYRVTPASMPQPGYVAQGMVAQWVGNSGCHRAALATLSMALDRYPHYCARGGDATLERQLRRNVAALLTLSLVQASKAPEYFSPSELQQRVADCIAQPSSSVQCQAFAEFLP